MIRRFEIHDDQGETIAEGAEFSDTTVAVHAPHGTAVTSLAGLDQPLGYYLVWIDNILAEPAQQQGDPA